MGVVEDSSNEEAGQDKEQFNSVGPVLGHFDDGAFDPVARRHIGDEVEQQDHQDSEAPHPVQHRQVSTLIGPRPGTRRGRELRGGKPACTSEHIHRADNVSWVGGHDGIMVPTCAGGDAQEQPDGAHP